MHFTPESGPSPAHRQFPREPRAAESQTPDPIRQTLDAEAAMQEHNPPWWVRAALWCVRHVIVAGDGVVIIGLAAAIAFYIISLAANW